MKTVLVGGLALSALFLPGHPAYCAGGVPGGNGKTAEDELAGHLTEKITAAGKQDKKLEEQLASAPPAEKTKIERQRSALGAKVASLAGRFKTSPAVQDAGAGFMMARKDFAGAGSLAEQGLKYASPDGDPKLTARLLVTRGTSRWVAGDMPGACSDGEQAHEMDPGNRGAFELGKYSCGRGPRGEGSAKSEKVERLVSLQDGSIAHTHEEWAERQERTPTPSGSLSLKAIRAHRKGDLGAAMSFADGAVRADPDDPMARFQRGYLRGEMNDHNGAITDLTEAITLGWKDKVLFKLRGSAMLMAGRNAAALEDAEMAVALSPDYAEAYYLRATAKMQTGRPIGETLADLKIAAELEPDKYGDFYRKTKKDFAGMELAQRSAPSAELGGAESPASDASQAGNGAGAARTAAPAAAAQDWSKRLPVIAAALVAIAAIMAFALVFSRRREPSL